MTAYARIFNEPATKPLMLQLPEDIRDVVLYSRFLQQFQGSGTRIYSSAHEAIVRLLSFVSDNIASHHPAENAPGGFITFDLSSPENDADSCRSVPYMHIPADAKAAAEEYAGCSDRVKVALCLENTGGLEEAILSGFSVNQLMNLDFHIFLKSGQPFNRKLPSQINYSCHCLDENIDLIAAVMERMDLVLAEENVFACLAGALGKTVWLFVPENADTVRIKSFIRIFEKTCPVRISDASYLSAFRKVSLFLYFMFSDTFEPFSTGCKDLQITDVAHIDDIYVEDIDSISSILDVSVACLNNIQIETTSICNLQCSYCPNSSIGREPAYMDEEMFCRIIDSLHDYIPDYSGTLSPHFYGEPLIDTRLERLIAYARKRLPGSVIELYTNGELLTTDRYMVLKNSGVDLFKISQHTDLPSKVLENTLTYVQQHHPDLFTVDYKIFRDVKYKMNRGGLVETETVPLELMRRCTGCAVAHRVMTFDYKGNALLCCNDYLSKHAFGNICSKSVKDIWEGAGYRRVRNLLMFGYMPFDICKTCCGLSAK